MVSPLGRFSAETGTAMPSLSVCSDDTTYLNTRRSVPLPLSKVAVTRVPPTSTESVGAPFTTTASLKVTPR